MGQRALSSCVQSWLPLPPLHGNAASTTSYHSTMQRGEMPTQQLQRLSALHTQQPFTFQLATRPHMTLGATTILEENAPFHSRGQRLTRCCTQHQRSVRKVSGWTSWLRCAFPP